MNRLRRGLMLMVGMVMAVGGAWAADPKDGKGTVKKTAQGLSFQVPPDWPIEKRNGVVGPIPVEEYLTTKFGAFEARVQSLEKQQTALEMRLSVMQEELKKQKGLKSVEGGTP